VRLCIYAGPQDKSWDYDNVVFGQGTARTVGFLALLLRRSLPEKMSQIIVCGYTR
jgi:hypothetical protein